MKICAFADIHGNRVAWDAALELMLREDVDRYLYLGDSCGYYFDQLAVYARLKHIPGLISVLGNHDRTFLEIAAGDEKLRRMYLHTYGPSTELLLDSPHVEFKTWLQSLPDKAGIPEIKALACHGAPWNLLDGYVYPDTDAHRFQNYAVDFFFIGHTHHPMFREVGPQLIINPGSLGQPRNGQWPTYAVVDCLAKTVAFREVRYDKQELLAEIEARDDSPAYLKDVLLR